MGGTTAQNWVGITGASLTIKDDDTLDKPAGVKLSVDGTKVQVDWTAVTGAGGYKVEWSDSATFDTQSHRQPGHHDGHDPRDHKRADQRHDVLLPGDCHQVRATTTPRRRTRSAWPPVGTDYDADNDGLIDVNSLAKLNAIRYDLDGDGMVDNALRLGLLRRRVRERGGQPGPAANPLPRSLPITTTPATRPARGYELTANLDFDTNSSGGPNAGDTYWNSGQGWLPIGATAGSLTAGAYTGEFDGGSGSGTSYTISNLHLNRSGSTTVAHGGLFAQLGSGAVVKNLRLKNVSVTVATNASATSAADVYAGGVAGTNAGSITGSYVLGAVKAVQSDNTGITTEEDAYAGGIVAKNTGSITSSYSRADVTAEQKSATASKEGQAGGLVGIQDGSSATITASFSTGTVVALSQSATGAAADAGGLVGRNHDGKISHSYSHAHAEAKGTTASATLTAGGLVGELDGGTVEYSFATGKPTTASTAATPTERKGGLAGHQLNSPTVTASYWDTTTSGVTSTGAGTGKTTTELQTPDAYGTQSTDIYKDWNVDLDTTTAGTQDPWNFGTASQYPVLKFGLTAADQRAAITLTLSRTNICETTKGSDTNACGSNNVTSATLTAALSPAQPVPVTVDIAEVAASYTLQHNGTFTFAAGDTSKTMTVTAVNNTTNAPTDYTATLTPSTSMNWVGLPTAPTLTIEDDDFGLSVPSLTVTTPSVTSATLTWAAVADATGYKLEYKEAADSSWTDGGSVTSPHTVSSLTSGGVYTFRVAATKTGYDDGSWGSVSSSPGIDYDSDDDGLIEITTLARLNAIRWDLDGDGAGDKYDSNNDGDYTDSGEYDYSTNYSGVFTTPKANMGCNDDETSSADKVCTGYELSNDLDFDSDDDGDVDANDHSGAYWNSGAGWLPIGGTGGSQYTASFVGNDYEIDNLFINRTSGTYAGLFAYVKRRHRQGERRGPYQRGHHAQPQRQHHRRRPCGRAGRPERDGDRRELQHRQRQLHCEVHQQQHAPYAPCRRSGGSDLWPGCIGQLLLGRCDRRHQLLHCVHRRGACGRARR